MKFRRFVGILLLIFALLMGIQVTSLRLGDFEPKAVSLPENIDTYLAESEAPFDDLREGANKQIAWARATGEKTPIALVYAHGFSASRGEIHPVSEKVADAFGANVFYMRFNGHGRSPDAMAEASVEDWLNDLNEALRIAERLGEKTYIIATSTAAASLTWLLAERSELAEQVTGVVLVSPNFGAQAAGSFMLTWPGAQYFVPLVVGERRNCGKGNQTIWTECYPTVSVLPMARIVYQAKRANVEGITKPLLAIYSPNDKVVQPKETEAILKRWGGETLARKIDESGHDNKHVIAGDALSPETTDRVVEYIVDWLSQNGAEAGSNSNE